MGVVRSAECGSASVPRPARHARKGTLFPRVRSNLTSAPMACQGGPRRESGGTSSGAFGKFPGIRLTPQDTFRYFPTHRLPDEAGRIQQRACYCWSIRGFRPVSNTRSHPACRPRGISRHPDRQRHATPVWDPCRPARQHPDNPLLRPRSSARGDRRGHPRRDRLARNLRPFHAARSA